MSIIQNEDNINNAEALESAQYIDTKDIVSAVAVDINVANRFLSILDPAADEWFFQTFADSKLSSYPWSTYARVANALTILGQKQCEGSGVFVTINQTDGKGRARHNILKVRAIFADCDGADPQPMIDKLTPHIHVESSPGKHHLYWIVSDCSLDQFKGVQKAIATQYGTDPAVNDVSRVMRLPGSWHLKGAPFQCRIESINEIPPYTTQQIIDVLGLSVNPPQASLYGQLITKTPSPEPLEKIRSALAALPQHRIDSYPEWRDIGFALHWQFQGDETGFELFDTWSKKSEKHGDTRSHWEGFKSDRANGITIGTLYHWAKEDGWVWASYALTDVGNAERLIDQRGQNLRYLSNRGHWLMWNGQYWEADSKNQITYLAIEVIKAMGIDANQLGDLDLQTKQRKWSAHSQAVARISGMTTLARSLNGVAVILEELDSNPWLFNCQNVTIDLKTLAHYQAKQSDLITKVSPVIYDPSATCPVWIKFLDRIFGGNEDLIEFIQRSVGYSLTGVVTDETLFFLYGSGANGKSTFIETVMKLLENYTVKLSLESLLKKNISEGIPNDIARLKGTRLCVSSEIDQGGRFNESKLKDLASRDTISARFLHGEFFDFRQSHKLWIYGNHRPVIHGSDDGIWRRIKLIPFEVTIPDDEKDHELDQKLLGELSGIFNWALQGCADWQRHGLKVPQCVLAATAGYREEMDIIGNFIDEKCDIGNQYSTTAKHLLENLREWCDENGHRPPNVTDMSQRLQAKGYGKKRTSSGNYYQGIQVRDIGRNETRIAELKQSNTQC